MQDNDPKHIYTSHYVKNSLKIKGSIGGEHPLRVQMLIQLKTSGMNLRQLYKLSNYWGGV